MEINMKKLLLSLISAMLCLMLCFSIFAAEKVEIKMTIGESIGYVNGEAKELDAAPIIKDNRTMLPVHFVAENLGATVEWDGENSTATLTTDEAEIKITIGAPEAYVNGEPVALDAPAFIENSRTYLPVRFVAENLGATVEWDGETSTATITLGGFVPFPDDYTLAYPDNFDYTEADLTEYVKLGQYKGLNITANLPPEITEEDVDTYLDELLAQNPARKEITDRTAEVGDNIIVNFIGKLDGVEFEGGTAYGYEITLGNGGFIEGFEEGMIGMKVGETKNVETVFPANYGNADLAGKTAMFEITLLSIYEEVTAELTDVYVKETFDYNTVEEFKEAIKADLIKEREDEVYSAKLNAVIVNITGNAEIIKIPEGLVDDYMYTALGSVKQSAAQYGLSYEALLMYSGYTVETYETMVREVGEANIAATLVTMSVAKAEGITATKEECDTKIITPLMQAYGLSSTAELCAIIGTSEEYLYNLAKQTIIDEKIVSFLIANNTFTE